MPATHIKDQSDLTSKLEAAGGKLVVIDFYATWCGPCKMIAPVLDQLSNDMKDSVLFFKVDVDENEDIAADYKVTVMPTFAFVKNKAKIDEFAGANETKLRELIEKHK